MTKKDKPDLGNLLSNRNETAESLESIDWDSYHPSSFGDYKGSLNILPGVIEEKDKFDMTHLLGYCKLKHDGKSYLLPFFAESKFAGLLAFCKIKQSSITGKPIRANFNVCSTSEVSRKEYGAEVYVMGDNIPKPKRNMDTLILEISSV